MSQQKRHRGSKPIDTPSARTAARPQTRLGATRKAVAETPAEKPKPTNPRLRRGLRITQRAIIMIFVIILLLLSYAATLQVYFNQQHQIAETRLAIEEHEAAIRTLEEEIARWQDDDFVKTQARERLGWVLPGQIGFRVVGPDGEPYGGGQQIGTGSLPEGEQAKTWWERMWRSVGTADDPKPEEDNTPTEPITAPEEDENP